MLDMQLARLAQLDRERDVVRALRARAVRQATEPSTRETFVPPSPESRPARWVRVGDGRRFAPGRGA